MIQEIIELLEQDKFYNVRENVEIVKGKNQITTTWKCAFEKMKRIWLLRR